MLRHYADQTYHVYFELAMTDKSFPKLSDFDEKQLIWMADEHDDIAFATALGAHPAMKREGGFCEIITGHDDPFANMAFGMNVPDPENRVKAISDRLSSLSVPGYFWVGPCTKPANLDEILVQNGWRHIASPPAMVVDLHDLRAPQLPIGFELREVTSDDDLKIWQETVAKGFHLRPEVAQMFSSVGDPSMRYFTAFIDDQPAGTTALFIHKGVPGIYSVCTLPEFRGRGIGSALTSLPFLDARAGGCHIGTLQASKMGLPIYQRLGFQEVCKLKLFSFGLP